MRRGEVHWYRFARPDRNRPVLILTRSSSLEVLDSVTAAPITSTIRDIPTEVVLEPEDGVPQECAINLDHVQTVPRVRVGSLITTLTSDRMTEVGAALGFALGFTHSE